MVTGGAFFELGKAQHRYRRTVWVIWLSALLLSGLVSWHVLDLTRDDHQRHFSTARRDLANLTRVSQEHASRTLRSADQVASFVQAGYLERGSQLDLTAMRRQGVIDTEIFNQADIVDASAVDPSEQASFEVPLLTDAGALFVSQPVVDRVTDKWSIQLTRRLHLADGRFGGLVVLSVDPEYFTRFYGELDLGSKGLMGLYGLDGVGRARRVGQKDEFGTNAAKSVMFDQLREGQLEGSYTEYSAVDGVQRLYYFRKIPGYPMVVMAGRDTEELLANHFSNRDVLRWQAVMMIALIGLLAAALTRFLLKLRRAMVARITAQHEAQERTEQLNAIFALSPDGFISFDVRRHVAFVNPVFYQMAGRGEGQLDGLSEQDFSFWLAERCVGGSAFSGVAAMRARLQAGKPGDRELIRLQMRAKKVLQVELRCNPSGPVSQILYFRDISLAAEVDAMKSEFVATAAHELRTPMTSILGFTELLLSQEHEAPAQREYLSIVLERAQLMARIMSQLLDLARIEAHRGRDFRYTGIDVQKLVTSVVQLMQLPAEGCPPVLQFPSAPPLLLADGSMLKQALAHVLANAYKYARPNVPNQVSVAVTVKTGCGGEQQLCIEVADTGIGMSPEQSGRIFERFYRADASGSVGGTGLGMSIVKEIVDLHHGQVKVVSGLGRGTCVCLCLPLETSHSQVE
jgi:signal transduction histidine kinase